MAEKLKLPALKGLRPKEEFLYESSFLSDCNNVYLSETGLFEAGKFTRTFNINESAQIFKTRIGIFVATPTALYSYADETLSLLFSVQDNGRWSYADFGVYIALTNGKVNLVRNVKSGSFVVNNDTFPVANAICDHRGRLIILSSKSYAVETLGISGYALPGVDNNKHIHNNFVGWSVINELKFQSPNDPDRTNLSGYMPMEFSGKLLRVEPLKNHFIVYGENGIAALTLAGTRGYGLTTLHQTGIKAAGAVCVNGEGDGATRHYFIDTAGDLYTLDANLSLTKLWYREFLGNEPVRMTYNVLRSEALITFGNDETFVFGESGLTKVTGDIEDVAEYEGGTLVHSPSTITQDDLSVTTNIVDFGSSTQKYLHGISANITAPEDITVTIFYRSNRNAEWSSTAAKTFDKATSYVNAGRISGAEFYVHFLVEDYTAFQLSELTMKYSKISGGLEDG
jgi:hypothetical protein